MKFQKKLEQKKLERLKNKLKSIIIGFGRNSPKPIFWRKYSEKKNKNIVMYNPIIFNWCNYIVHL